jgi:hypothetical protein
MRDTNDRRTTATWRGSCQMQSRRMPSESSRTIWAAELLAVASAVLNLRSFDFIGTISRVRHAPWNEGQEEHRFIEVQEGSVRALSIAILPCESSLFASSDSPTLLGRYHWTGQWLLCRIFSVDGDRRIIFGSVAGRLLADWDSEKDY